MLGGPCGGLLGGRAPGGRDGGGRCRGGGGGGGRNPGDPQLFQWERLEYHDRPR